MTTFPLCRRTDGDVRRSHWARLRAIVGSVVSLTAVLLTGCGGKADEPDGEAVQPDVTVETGVAAVGPFRATITVLGAVQARPGHVAALGAPGPARVATVQVATGDRVSPGAVLVELDQAPFAAAAQAAESQLTAAERTHDRVERLVGDGIMAKRELDQAVVELEQARAAVTVARRALELSVLRAPFAGVVTRMEAVLGSSVDANQLLVEVADPTTLDVVLRVTSSQAARIRRGSPVRLSAGEGAQAESLGSSVVSDVGVAVDSTTRSVPVRVHAGGLSRALRIGETVYGSIAVGMRARTVSVPASALVPEGDRYRVFVVDSANVAHAQAVQIGARSDSTIEILDGLKGGERIVTSGAFGVTDSARVVQPKR